MNADFIRSIGGFVSSVPTKVPATWVDDDGTSHTFDVLVRKAPFGAVERLVTEVQKTGEELLHQNAAICVCVVDESGAQAFTYKESCELQASLANAIYAAVVSGNGGPVMGKPNRSRMKKSSGTS